MRYKALFLVVFVGLVGCNTTGGKFGTMNVQRSGLRGAGDLSVTVMLDQIPTDEVLELKTHIEEFLYAVRDFADTGNIATITRTELTNRLLEEVADEYAQWVRMALDATLTTLAPQAEIGDKNRLRLIAFVRGSLTATACYRIEDRLEERSKIVLRRSIETGLPAWPETVVGNAKVKTERRP